MEGIGKCIEKRYNLRNVQRKRKVGAVLNNYRKIFREYADVIRGHHVFLFDLDQTLLDFHASEYKGLKIVVEAEGYEFNDDLYGYFKARNKELWLELEKGTISRTDLFKTRFRLLFEKCGADTAGIDLLKTNGEFISAMAGNGVLMDGALDFLKKLRENIRDSRVYIVTNGVQENAEGRMRSTGLDRFIDGMFVSETLGATKPSAEYFGIVLNTINERREDCIVIGDSLTSDMLGAKNAGLTSCWFMPEGDIEKAMMEYDIDYCAASFDELYDVLERWACR